METDQQSEQATEQAPTQVRAKFVVDEIRNHRYNGQKTLVLAAVYGTQGENAAFTKATPSGRLEMLLAADGTAKDAFPMGRTFYVDFTPVE